MKLLFAPDTTDHPNWGCRVMGAWFRLALARKGCTPAWLGPSGWFINPHPSLPNLNTMADFHHYAREVQAGRILADIAAVLQQCDAVLLNGENYIRPSTYKGRMLLFLIYLVKEVFHKPCILTNHSVDLDESALAEIVREIYPLLDEVHFREETSVEACASLVKAGRWKLIPDVAFAVPAAPRAEWSSLGCRDGQFSAWPDTAQGFDPRKPYVTVCGSSIYALPQHQHLDPVPAFIRLCDRLQKEVGPVILTAPCEIDARIMRKVQSITGLPLIGNGLPVRQAIDIIGNAAVHVGGRWHLGIFAATGGTPTVAIGANSHKVHSLARLLGTVDPVFDALRLDTQIEPMVAQAKAHIAAGPALRQRLQARSRELGAQVDQTLDWLRAQPSLTAAQPS